MKLIILDRDGVINEESDTYITSPEEWVPIPGSLEAIARLNHGGYRVLVATNQAGLARGLFTVEVLNAIHCKMHRELARLGGQVEAVFFCPHGPNDSCLCRKPLPGLFDEIAKRLKLNLSGIPFIGDSLRDIQAAQAVGASPTLVLTGKGSHTLAVHGRELTGVPFYTDLLTVVDSLFAS